MPIPEPRWARDRWKLLCLGFVISLFLAGLLGWSLHGRKSEEPVRQTDDYDAGVAAYDKRDYDLAIACFSAYIRANPNLAEGFIFRGMSYCEKKDHEKALKDFGEAIRLDPKSDIAYGVRGALYRHLKEYDKALTDFNKQIRLDPMSVPAFNNRGVVYVDIKEYDKALKDVSEAIRFDAKYPRTYSNRAWAYNNMKEYDLALKDCTEAIRLDPKDAWAFLNRGRAYKGKKEYDNAIKDYQESIQLDPKLADAPNYLAWLLATCPKDSIRDGKRAVQLATKACELSEWKNWHWIGTLAASYAECGDLKEAIKRQKKAIELRIDDKEELEKALKRLKLYEEGKA
jgi:tetratricopeptide (TPR) repeat protein